MSRSLVFLLLVFSLSKTLSEVSGSENRATTKSFKEDTLGDVLEINEDGPLFKNQRDSSSNYRSFNSEPFDLNHHTMQDDLTKMTLREFLQFYAKKHNTKPAYNEEEDISQHNKKPLFIDDTTHNIDKDMQNYQEKVNSKDRKSWTLVDVQKHKHPFEDKKGWVSLDPIPWSVSKISKWQSKYKPVSDRPWDEHGPISSSQSPYVPDEHFEYKRPVSITPPSPYMYHQQPTESSDRYDTFYDHVDRPKPTAASNIYPRPTALFGHKVHVETHFPSNSYTSTGKPYPYHLQQDCNHPNHPFDGIMTDGMAPNFPEPSPYDKIKRRGTEMEIHPDSHPVNGEGEWVLLSTTKGYKPQRSGKRSLNIEDAKNSSQSMRTTRGIRLTVLPPLKGSKVNMTTSHGGLLQVESTFESVEQAKQKFDKRQTILKIKGKRKRRKNIKKSTNKKGNRPVEETHQTVATVPKNSNDPGAVMAAVGAGMIPATMAMMVPIAMSGG